MPWLLDSFLYAEGSESPKIHTKADVSRGSFGSYSAKGWIIWGRGLTWGTGD